MVIKVYIYIPIPVLITETPIKGVNMQWVSKSKRSDPSKLSASLYHWLKRPAGALTAKLN
jgi:hypothetical protein